MLAILLGFVIGIKLGSWWVANALALFLGLNPAFLLFEYTIMPDMLSVFLVLSLFFLWSVEGEIRWYKAAAMGAAVGACVLIRSSAVPLCAVFVVGTLLVRCAHDRAALADVKNSRSRAAFFGVLILTALLVVGPWLWRNLILYDKVSPVNFQSRNLLIYKAMHDDLDMSLPLMEKVNGSSENVERVDYIWLGKLSQSYSSNEAERIARDLVWEQVTSHLRTQLLDMAETFLSFGGLSPTSGNDRFALRFWFTYLVPDSESVARVNVPPSTRWVDSPFRWAESDFVYVPTGGDSALIRYWSLAGLWYLDLVRPALFVLFFLMLVLLFALRGIIPSEAQARTGVHAVLVCGAAYLVTVLGHTLTLTDNDRYIASLDLLSFLVSATIVAYLFRFCIFSVIGGWGVCGARTHPNFPPFIEDTRFWHSRPDG
jgi:hypothetical protein